jgi:hypothetical protein
MGRDLGPNPARYIGPCRPSTKIFRVVPCLGRAFFSVLWAGPSGPVQMYTYSCNGPRRSCRSRRRNRSRGPTCQRKEMTGERGDPISPGPGGRGSGIAAGIAADAWGRIVGARVTHRLSGGPRTSVNVPIDVQTGGTARPSPSPTRPGPFEPGTVRPDHLIVPCRAARRAQTSSRARHGIGPTGPGRPE